MKRNVLRDNIRQYIFGILLYSVLCAVFFGPVLFGNEIFAFRDGSHFYAPLYEYVHTELANGRIPLWNPCENFGTPILGNPVSAVFYPLKLIFFLPIGFEKTYSIFIVFHVFLAAFNMFQLARHFGRTPNASHFAAIVYAFGGSVLYQHLNIVFLIGAAWLPASLRASDLVFTTKNLFQSVKLAIFTSLIILGGDIQAAYISGLLIVLLAFFRLDRTTYRTGIANLLLAGLLTFLISAVQILPAYEFADLSDRRNPVYTEQEEISAIDRFLVRDQEMPGHQRTMYFFSVGPWRFIEYVWPNIGGKQFPQNSRWFSAIYWDNYVWSPSLYTGIVPFLLLLSVFRYRKSDGITKWLILVLLGSVLGSLGYFGLGWFLRQFCIVFGISDETVTFGDPFGGVYWFLNTFVPGFSNFRYPAKLLTVAAIPFALLAGKGFDQLFKEDGINRNVIFLTLFLFILGGAVFLVSIFWNGFWELASRNAPDCPIFGPFQENLARKEFLLAVLQSLAVLSVFMMILASVRKSTPRKRNLLMVGLLALLSLDLYAGNSWMIATAPRPEPIDFPVKSDSVVPPRIYRYPVWCPERFSHETSPERLAENLAWDRNSLFPKFNLRENLNIVDVRGTMLLAEHARYMNKLRKRDSQFYLLLAEAGIEYMVLPERIVLDPLKFERIDSKSIPEDTVLWRIKNSFPRARIKGSSGKAKIIEYGPNRVLIEAESTVSDSLLILSDAPYPGWVCTLDNRKVPIESHKEVFRAIKIPEPGKHRIEFHYNPGSFRYGAILSLAGIFITVILSIFTNRKQFRARCVSWRKKRGTSLRVMFLEPTQAQKIIYGFRTKRSFPRSPGFL